MLVNTFKKKAGKNTDNFQRVKLFKSPTKSFVNKSVDYIQQLLDRSRSKFSLHLRMFILTKKEQKTVIFAAGASCPEFPKICLIRN